MPDGTFRKSVGRHFASPSWEKPIEDIQKQRKKSVRGAAGVSVTWKMGFRETVKSFGGCGAGATAEGTDLSHLW